MTELVSYERKLERAEDHLHAMAKLVESWLAEDPCVLADQGDISSHVHSMRLHILVAPPDSIAPLVADCLHNMRHALDHLAYLIAIAVTGSDPPANEATSEFPGWQRCTRWSGSLSTASFPWSLARLCRALS